MIHPCFDYGRGRDKYFFFLGEIYSNSIKTLLSCPEDTFSQTYTHTHKQTRTHKEGHTRTHAHPTYRLTVSARARISKGHQHR